MNIFDILPTYPDQNHTLNIMVHTIFGAAAILLGVIQLLRRKGDSVHRRIGRLYVLFFCVVLATAVLGLIVFDYRPHLVLITLNNSYGLYSGVRVVFLKERRATLLDHLISLLTLAALVVFVATHDLSALTWPAPVMYSSAGFLGGLCLYDLARVFHRTTFRQRVWIREHMVKIVFSWGGLLSAGAGNVLRDAGMIAQLGPSIISTGVILRLLIRFPQAAKPEGLNRL